MKLHIRGRETRAEYAGRDSTRTAHRSSGMTLAAVEPNSCTGSAARASRTFMSAHFGGGHIHSAQLRRQPKHNPTTSRSTPCAP